LTSAFRKRWKYLLACEGLRVYARAAVALSALRALAGLTSRVLTSLNSMHRPSSIGLAYLTELVLMFGKRPLAH
jgi:hypothetical protein